MASLTEIINKGKSGIITIKTAFERLKQANPTLNDSDIGHFLNEMRTSLDMVAYNPETRQKDYLLGWEEDHARKLINNIINSDNYDSFVDLTCEDVYGWLETPFYKLLADKGIDLTPPPEPEEVFIFDGLEFATLGDVVDEIARLNPQKKINKDRAIKGLSNAYDGFYFNYTPEDGNIPLALVKTYCDRWGLYFPWQPLDNSDAPANSQDTQALSQEVQTLKTRITELKQANQQLTQKLADSQAEIERLHSELDNRPLAGENKPDTNTLTLKHITEPLKIIQVMQERYYGENFDPNDTDTYPTEEEITCWIRGTYKYKEQPALAIYKVGYLPKPKLKK